MDKDVICLCSQCYAAGKHKKLIAIERVHSRRHYRHVEQGATTPFYAHDGLLDKGIRWIRSHQFHGQIPDVTLREFLRSEGVRPIRAGKLDGCSAEEALHSQYCAQFRPPSRSTHTLT